MPDLLQTAADWLTGTLKASVSQPIMFRRGLITVELDATLGSTEWTSETLEGFASTWESRDFLIQAADLVLAGLQVEPIAGDKVDHTINGQTFTYEVLSQTGVPPFVYCDPGRVGLRIHTKLVAR